MKAPAPLTIVDFRGDELEKARVSVAEATGAGRAEALRGAAGDLARQGVPQKEAVEVLQSACHQNGFIRERGLAAFQQTFAAGWKAGLNGSDHGASEDRPAKVPGKEGIRFRIIPFGQMKLGTTSPYLVRNIIPREGVVVIWGPPKCGKSFWTFDLVMHIALGREYRKRRVKQGPVVYIACEGERGLSARAEAYRHEHLGEEEDVPGFSLMVIRLDLVKDQPKLIADIRGQLGGVAPAAIVIDTLNRSLAGSENSDEDMSNYVKAADAIREAFKCAVVIIHHCGKDGNRPRGHTSLTGAVDAQIAVSRDDDGLITTTVEYMKDGPEGEKVLSRLKTHVLGKDDDGEDITSCVIEPADGEGGGQPKPQWRKEVKIGPKVSAATRVALDLLRKAIDADGEAPPAARQIPPTVRAVRVNLWREYCYSGSVADSDKPDAKQKAFKRSVTTLRAAKAIGLWNEWVWLT
jgi:hypothetical protein